MERESEREKRERYGQRQRGNKEESHGWVD